MLYPRPRNRFQAALLVMLLGLLAASPPTEAAGPPPLVRAEPVAAQAQATPAWPPSAGLLVSEVVTGGASASDEYVELYNAAPSLLSLADLELVYVSATGGTVTRKQAWTELYLQPGQHLLLANSAGAFAGQADGLYSGGFAASGGSLVLRAIGGAVIDSLSWGDAANSFVEGAGGPAPSAGTSLERRPGGAAGNASDTNDNLADTRLEPAPVPQGLAAPAVPAVTPSPSAVTAPSVTPEPTLAPEPTAEPTAEPTPDPQPTVDPEPEPTVPPEPEPTLEPEPSAGPIATPTGEPGPSPSPVEPGPSPSPAPSPSSVPGPGQVSPIAAARSLPLGSRVTVRGWLTTPAGLTEGGTGAFVQDDSAGIALYLPSADWAPSASGSSILVSGVLETRFSLLTLRLAAAADLEVVGDPVQLAPLSVLTGDVGESIEGRLVSVEAVVSDGITSLTDGFSTALDDGSGAVRVVVAAASGIAPESFARGTSVRLVGVVGQRDSSGTGAAGYRLHPRAPADVERLAVASPSPSVAPSASPGPSATPSAPSPTPEPTFAPTPGPAPDLLPIGLAREAGIGQHVAIRGVVTVGPGRILGENVIALQDETGGICVKLPAGSYPELVAGRLVEASGVLAAPYGNLELRVVEGDLAPVGTASQPAVREVRVAELGEATEGLLARVRVTIRRVDSGSAGSVTLIVDDSSGEGRIFLHGSLGLTRSDFATGQGIAATGIVGDRLGLYRLWPRSESDISLLAGGGTGPGATPTPVPTAPPGGGPAGPVITIAQALNRQGERVTIEGIVSTLPGLLDADPRRVAVQDSDAAVLVRLAADGPAATVGQRLRLTGQMGTYYGAPQLTAGGPGVVVDRNVAISPVTVSSAPIAAGLEWRLVTLSGTLESVRRDGQAWRAELSLGGAGVPIVGLPRSGLASTLLAAGHRATITGIVRRAYPTATDQRLAVIPRSAADIRLGTASGPAPSAQPDVTGNGGAGVKTPAQGSAEQHASDGPPRLALSELAGREGLTVRIAGRIQRLEGLRAVVNDGSGMAAVRLSGRAAPISLQLQVGMLLNAEGTVQRSAVGGLEVHVADPGRLSYALSPVGTGSPQRVGNEVPAPVGEPPASAVAQRSGNDPAWLPAALLLAAAAVALAFMVLDARRLGRWREVAGRLLRRVRHGPPI